jgi:hypothetical protein
VVWKPGQTGNPAGRPRKYPVDGKYPAPPPGVDPKDFYGMAAYRDEYRNIAEAHGLEDPVLYQHKLLQDNSLPVGLRATIAAAISPYYRPKLGLQSPPRMVEIQVEVPDFKTVEEAEAFLNKIASLVGSGELSLSTGLDLSALVRNWISAKHQAAELELKRLNATQDIGPQTIRIEGGLPELPGTEVIMPQLNGHATNVIDHIASPVEPQGEDKRE